MIVYAIEFLVLHSLFYGVYKVMLAKETQLGFLRFFLVGSTVLSLVLPIVEIPTKAQIPSIDTATFVLPLVSSTISETSTSIPWYWFLAGGVSVLFVFKLVLNVMQIFGWYRQSETDTVDAIAIRKVLGLQNSFTFFQWIFIDPNNFENPEDIIRHEQGHAKNWHSIDLLFFHTLTIFFWWVPTLWFMIKELKAVHEFEADDYAIKINDSTYTKTLVHCTLKAHGMDLASSFDDAPIFNRLNFMKKMKKKISSWKVASIATIIGISTVMFACEEELNNGITEIVEEANQQIEYSDDVKVALDRLRIEKPNEEFTVIETKIDNEENINRLNAYDPNQIEQIFVTKDGDEKSIVMIVNKSSALFEKTLEVQESNSKDSENEVFTIVEKMAEFPGGTEAFGQYLSENMRYPAQAQRLGVQGRVMLQFIVEKDGSLSDITVLKGIGAGCDGEAIRILQESPKWTAGTQRGEKVRQKMVVPIAFSLNEN